MRTLFRLALAAGRVADFEDFARSVPARVLGLWQAYDRLEPAGREEDWRRTAQLCAAVVNANPFRGKDAPAVPFRRFLPSDLAREPVVKKAVRQRREFVGLALSGMKAYGPDGEQIDPRQLL